MPMAIRRFVTEEHEGRSRLAATCPVPGDEFREELWLAEPADPLGRALEEVEPALEPAPGAAQWRVHAVPTTTQMREWLGTAESESDPLFFHQTHTLDYVYVLDGDLDLVLEEGDPLELHAGDCVVQRATNHAWRNDSDRPVHLLAVMIGLP
jgi:hypothetical protein